MPCANTTLYHQHSWQFAAGSAGHPLEWPSMKPRVLRHHYTKQVKEHYEQQWSQRISLANAIDDASHAGPVDVDEVHARSARVQCNYPLHKSLKKPIFPENPDPEQEAP